LPENRFAPVEPLVEQPLPKVKPQADFGSKAFSAYSRCVVGMTKRSSSLAIAITWYIASTCSTERPTCFSTSVSIRPSTVRARMCMRIAIIRCSASTTGASKPAVSRLAR
jgi:hypothetical protein